MIRARWVLGVAVVMCAAGGCAQQAHEGPVAPPAGGLPAVPVSTGPSAAPGALPSAARCPATTTVRQSQPGGPDTQLFPDGATALTVCRWSGGGPAGGGTYRLASARSVPTGRVAADLAALNSLTSGQAQLACSAGRPWLRLSVVAGYPGGRTATVQLIEPCSEYLTNGTVDADPPQSMLAALTSGRPLAPVPSGVLTVRLTTNPPLRPGDPRLTYEDGVLLMRGRVVFASLPRRPDGSYRARVPAGSYTLHGYIGKINPQPCTGRATVTAGRTTSAVVTCPVPSAAAPPPEPLSTASAASPGSATAKDSHTSPAP